MIGMALSRTMPRAAGRLVGTTLVRRHGHGMPDPKTHVSRQYPFPQTWKGRIDGWPMSVRSGLFIFKF